MTPQHESSVIRCQSFTRVAHFGAALPEDLVEQLWTEPDALLPTGDTLQRTSQRWTVRLTWASQTYVLKHYRPRWWHAVRQFAMPSRAWMTATTTYKLADAGIATPRPVACIENRWGNLRRDSFLMYPYVEGRTLRTYLSTEAKESRTLADSLWQQLGELWQRLGALNASLADANTGNFIVGRAHRLWVIDLDKARFHRSPSDAARRQQCGWTQLQRSAAKC